MKCPFVIKVCSKCGRLLVAYNGNFHKKKNGKYGLRANCKGCQKQWRENNEESIKENRKEYYRNNKEKEFERHKQWRKDNPDKIKGYSKKYREDNKDKIKEYKKDNNEHIKEQQKKWRENNPQYHKEYQKEYRKNNPEKEFNKNSKRRLKEESQGKGVTKEQWLEMMNFFNWRCAYSGEKLTNSNRTIDHIIPLSLGGKNEIWNCVPMYANYNFSKYNNDMLEWYTRQPFYSEERLNKIYKWIEYAKDIYLQQ